MDDAGVSSYHNRCRLCISEARLSLKLFETEALRLDVVNKIKAYLSIHISLHDGMPQQICYECLSRIELFHSYKQSCLESQHTLKHWNLFCEGGELQEEVLNGGVTSDVVEEKNGRQLMEAEEGSSRSDGQLQMQSSNVNSPKKTNSQSLTASPRMSKQLARQRNSTAENTVECKMLDVSVLELHDYSLTSQQNLKASLQDDKMQTDVHGNLTGVDIFIKRSPSTSSLIQRTLEAESGPLVTSLDSTLKPFEGNSDAGSGVECDEVGRPVELIRNNAPSSTAKQKSIRMGTKQISGSSISVLCNRRNSPIQNHSLLSQHNSKTCGQNERMLTDVLRNRTGVNMPMKRSSSSSLPIQNPLKAETSPLVTFPDLTSEQLEDKGNPGLESEDGCGVIDRSAREFMDNVSFTAVRHESAKVGTKKRNERTVFVHSVVQESTEAPRQNRSLPSRRNSQTSVHDERMQTHVLGKQSGLATPLRRSSSMSSLIQSSLKHDTCPLVTFPDSVVKKCSNEGENVEITAWLAEQEGNVITSENIKITSQKQNDFIQMNSEDVNYQSLQKLLKILESDEESDLYESDVENSQDEEMSAHNMYRPPTPGPTGRKKTSRMQRTTRDPMTAYVKVEKLTESKREIRLRVRSEAELKAVSPQTRKPSRSPVQKIKIQSNQYRMVKPVVDETTGKTRYKCLKCGSLLSHKHYIKEHMKIHTGDKSFACSVCDRAFRNNYMLKSHMVVHLAEKNFECGVCSHRFLGRERLKQHMRLHTIAPYVCSVCGRSCNQKQSLQRHMRVHTGERPYKCEFCDSAFADRTTWINHRRIHTGERPFKCKECNKTFSRCVNLQAHKRSHSDVRLFGCQLCMSRFKTKAHLVKHLSCIHKDLMKSVVNFMKEERPPE